MKIKPITFRVYPDGRWLYAEVNIWPTKKAMQDYKRCGRGYTAICTGMERINCRNGKSRKLGQFCEINFYRNAIGSGVVAHEMGHAAFDYAARRKIPIEQIQQGNLKDWDSLWDGKPKRPIAAAGYEERLVYALGEMVRQFTQKCYDLKIYP